MWSKLKEFFAPGMPEQLMQNPPPAPEPIINEILLPGDGSFRLQVVGEASYQGNLERICGPRGPDAAHRKDEARLILEDTNPYDRNAVRVEISGNHVGYLDRQAAKDYRAFLSAHGLPPGVGVCGALITGGWKRTSDEGNFGVSLDFTLYARRPLQLNDDQQPPPSLNAGNRERRSVSELVGMARGMLADGAITSAEVEMLVSWVADNPDLVATFPGNIVKQRLERYLADRFIDDDEIADLSDLLMELTGQKHGRQPGFASSTTLPLTRPAPTIEFNEREFVFTGKFYFGPRKACEREVILRGGKCHSQPRRATHYVVIGTLGSRDWIESPFGTKIRKAADMQAAGSGMAIVSEDHWASAL